MFLSKFVLTQLALLSLINLSAQNSTQLPTDSLISITYLDSCEQDQIAAQQQALDGDYKCLTYGLLLVEDSDFSQFYQNHLQSQYGITTQHVGCVVTEFQRCYNREMQRLITLRYGDDFFVNALKEAREAHKLQVHAQIDSGFIFKSVDTLPSFPGGYDSLQAYLQSNLGHLTATHIKILVTVVVEKDGSLSNVEITQTDNQIVIDDVKAICTNMPKWKPGIYCGKTARVRMA